jgi:hypothetical protein
MMGLGLARAVPNLWHMPETEVIFHSVNIEINMQFTLIDSAKDAVEICEITSQNQITPLVLIFLFIYCFFTIYSRYLKRVISKRDGCIYLKQVPSIDGSLKLI